MSKRKAYDKINTLTQAVIDIDYIMDERLSNQNPKKYTKFDAWVNSCLDDEKSDESKDDNSLINMCILAINKYYELFLDTHGAEKTEKMVRMDELPESALYDAVNIAEFICDYPSKTIEVIERCVANYFN